MVEDYQEKYEYVSDFDILIITKDKNSAKQVKKSRELEEELMANEEITRTSVIYHSIGFVNDKIERNYYFFVDILKEGIMLFDSEKFSLSEPKDLNPSQRVEKSTEEFEHWSQSASRFLEAFDFFFQKGENDIAYYSNAASNFIKRRNDIMQLSFLFSRNTSRESTTLRYWETRLLSNMQSSRLFFQYRMRRKSGCFASQKGVYRREV